MYPMTFALVHGSAAAHIDGAEVGIYRLYIGAVGVLAVIDGDNIAVAESVPTGIDHHTAVGGIDRVAGVAANIDAPVVDLRRIFIT